MPDGWKKKERRKSFWRVDLSGHTLYETIQQIAFDPIRYEHMAKMAKRLGKPDAALQVYHIMRQLADQS